LTLKFLEFIGQGFNSGLRGRTTGTAVGVIGEDTLDMQSSGLKKLHDVRDRAKLRCENKDGEVEIGYETLGRATEL
jgi:hypothetical protein